MITVEPALIVNALLNGIFGGLLYALVALGLALIFGVMDIINFAHGDFVMLGTYFTYIVVRRYL